MPYFTFRCKYPVFLYCESQTLSLHFQSSFAQHKKHSIPIYLLFLRQKTSQFLQNFNALIFNGVAPGI